jgi:hypothetical protein
MTYFSALPAPAYTPFTLAEWNHIVDLIVTLSRLCFPIPNIPTWDAPSARQTANFIPLVSVLQEKMVEVAIHFASTAITNTSDKKDKGRNINIPSLFSAVLSIVLQQYTDRISQESQLDIFDLNPLLTQSQDQGNSIYPMKLGMCPVMNGSLKGTEYWDAMGAFESDISGDAWMGHGNGGGEGVFDATVLDDWYLWGTKLPEWDEGIIG